MLEFRNVTKTFNRSGRKEDLHVALDHVNLKINDGEFVTVIGGNGSGKTTSLNIITGLLKPDSGQVLLNGVDITNRSEYQRALYFGHVFQDPRLGTAGDMSVLENLEIAYRRGLRHNPFKWGFRKSHKQLFIDQLKRFDLGLENRLNQKAGVMSGGQRQALTLLMATMKNEATHRVIRKIYINFFDPENKTTSKAEFDHFYRQGYKNYLLKRHEIFKTKGISRKEKHLQKCEEWNKFDSELRNKFDIGKQVLLLDEHTAALDPKTAKKVLELTDKIVKEKQMTTIMITHNMKDAITYGNRLIMYHNGHILHDISGEAKQKLTVTDLLQMFEEADKRSA